MALNLVGEIEAAASCRFALVFKEKKETQFQYNKSSIA
jgi:hypothetical protein